MKVKICGITSYEDAALALDAGADALGFNFFPSSPRYVDPGVVNSIIRRLPPFAVTVGLFVNVPDPDALVQTVLNAGVQVIQLHGDEDPAYCLRLVGYPLIKALRVGDSKLDQDLAQYQVRAFLLDAKDDVLFGGTGKTFDWSLAQGIDRKRPIILAGGLRADNVQAAISMVRPYGVDVCSGVELEPGKKDPDKLAEFMNEVRNVSR